MEEYNRSMPEEQEYLDKTINVLQLLIECESDKLAGRKKELVSTRRDMWENSSHFTDDFDRLTEMNQQLQQVQSRTADYENSRKNLEKYQRMIDCPYFGRFDFIEAGEYSEEKIYIGKGSIIDPKTGNIMVYDWRAPISSIYYRFEPGKVFYTAPFGEVAGEMKLKRQYKISKSQLKYFYDCSLQISDEMLQEVLGRNSSTTMRSIIETIQKEQDMVIRDTENELLIVQGVAGSGKTSIALHRIAFLLYEGMDSKISSNNILILSPNDAFSIYIGHVLPELGEENVQNATMEGIVKEYLKDELVRHNLSATEGRNKQLEDCISGRGSLKGEKVSQWLQFKGSKSFKIIMDRYLKLFEHRLLKFEDVYYHGRIVATRGELKAMFLDNKTAISMADRLDRIKSRIMDRIGELRKDRLNKIEGIVQKSDGHEFEVKSFSRLLLMKDSQAFAHRLEKFTELDIVLIYKGIFKSKLLFYKIAKGISLPPDIDEIIDYTLESLENHHPHYEDLTAMTYMKLIACGAKTSDDIQQVIIDEVQDYYPVQLAIMKELYCKARFTVVGDIAQSIERIGEHSAYDLIPELLQKWKWVRICLTRSYRSSYEINEFAKGIINERIESISFPRHEAKPEILFGKIEEELHGMLIERVEAFLSEGFSTVAVLCKTMKQTISLYEGIIHKLEVRLVTGSDNETGTGCMIMPVYASKGLEFDAVIIYGADESNYCTEMDRRLLYIACTRALHRLSLLYSGRKSRFIREVG